MDFGIYSGANSPWYIATIAAWFNHKSSNAALQAITAATAATAVTLSTTSVSFSSPADAGGFVATIAVGTGASGGPYVGTLTLGGADAAKFALSNGGVYPCNLMVGASNIGAGTYAINITAP